MASQIPANFTFMAAPNDMLIRFQLQATKATLQHRGYIQPIEIVKSRGPTMRQSP